MALDGNGEVSSCGRGIEDLGFRDDVTGVSVSVSNEEVDILSEGEDIMVGVSGAEVFFDGIYDAEEHEENVSVVRDDEDEYHHEFNDFEIHIDETLEIKDTEAYEVQEIHASGVESSEEIISRVRSLVQSLPLPGQISPRELELEHSFSLPGQISPQEVVHSFSLPGQISPREVVHSFSLPDQISPHEVVTVVNPQSSTSDNSFKETMYDGNNQTSPALKRKHEGEPGSSRQKHKDVVFNSMPSMFQEFEDFLNGSTKFQTVEPENKTASQLQMPAQAGEEDCNQNWEKRISEDSKTDLPVSESLVFPAKHIKDSYWTDMAIQTETESPVKLPAGDAKARKSVSARLSADVPNKRLSMKTSNNSHVAVAATTDKYSPAELILTFDQMEAIPSESKLNNLFRRFGPLIQTETLIHHESCCARVVFKKSSDAEVAVRSAKAFKIMGPSVVKYELGYTPLSVTSVMQIPESVAISVQEYEQVITAGELKPEDMPAQQMHSEQLEETSVAEISVPSESEEYEGLDDVNIME